MTGKDAEATIVYHLMEIANTPYGWDAKGGLSARRDSLQDAHIVSSCLLDFGSDDEYLKLDRPEVELGKDGTVYTKIGVAGRHVILRLVGGDVCLFLKVLKNGDGEGDSTIEGKCAAKDLQQIRDLIEWTQHT
jgi:hypothetical protein